MTKEVRLRPDGTVDLMTIPVKSLLPEDKTTRCGWGPFSLPAGHPFEPACAAHDLAFDRRETEGPGVGKRGDADKKLLADMLAIAKEKKSWKLRAQAYMLWAIAKSFGFLFW